MVEGSPLSAVIWVVAIVIVSVLAIARALVKRNTRPNGRHTSRPLACDVLPWYDRSMKVALSIPDDLFESGETLVKRLGVSRSQVYATALAEFVAKSRGRKITERLDAVYASEDSRIPPAVRRLQGRSLTRDPW